MRTWPVVQALLEHGAGATAEDEDGSTAVSLVRERNLQRHTPETMRPLESGLAESTKWSGNSDCVDTWICSRELVSRNVVVLSTSPV